MESFNARSWLFAPGDSDKKMQKATDSAADIVLIDLEDSVSVSEKPKARETVRAFLQANPAQRHRLWVRINPLQGPFGVDDLAAIMPGAPGGIMLPKARHRGDIETLNNYLTALEAAAGTAQGSTKVIVLTAETAEGVLTISAMAGAPRMVAMSWGAEDLSAEIGAAGNRNEDGGYAFTYELARSLCLLGATAAGVPAIETIEADFKNEAGLRKRAVSMRRAGFRGMLAIHPAQVDVINESFMPSAEEIAQAQEIVDIFAANPGVGAIGYKGGMLDRPYLARAEAVLALARK